MKLTILSVFLFSLPAMAKILPQSRHQQFQTYALLLEDHTFVLLQTQTRSYNQLAGHIALYEFENSRFKPQIVLSASVNAAIRLAPRGNDIFTETADNYINLQSEFTIDETTRFFLGIRNQSGHVTEDVLNKELAPKNSGNELLTFRFVKDLQGMYRVGGTFKPLVKSEPNMIFWGSDQFFEWFPKGFAKKTDEFVPYVSAGLEQSGVRGLILTQQLQAGFYAGNHHLPQNSPTLRFLVGFYSGMDPRLKYAQYKNTQMRFGYAGAMINF